MTEIDKIAERVKKLQAQNEPFMVAIIIPEDGIYKVDYNVQRDNKSIKGGIETFNNKDYALSYIQSIRKQHNIVSDENAIVINIISTSAEDLKG